MKVKARLISLYAHRHQDWPQKLEKPYHIACINYKSEDKLTYWLIKIIAMSSFVVNSLNASSIAFTVVSEQRHMPKQ